MTFDTSNSMATPKKQLIRNMRALKLGNASCVQVRAALMVNATPNKGLTIIAAKWKRFGRLPYKNGQRILRHRSIE